jgi:hypothetical protein
LNHGCKPLLEIISGKALNPKLYLELGFANKCNCIICLFGAIPGDREGNTGNRGLDLRTSRRESTGDFAFQARGSKKRIRKKAKTHAPQGVGLGGFFPQFVILPCFTRG